MCRLYEQTVRYCNCDTSSSSWHDSVEAWYSLRLTDPPAVDKSADKEAMKQLSTPPPKWSLEADEQLARFLSDHMNKQEANLGHASRFVESISVSSVSTLPFRPSQ